MRKRPYAVVLVVFVLLVFVAIAMRGDDGLFGSILPALHGR